MRLFSSISKTSNFQPKTPNGQPHSEDQPQQIIPQNKSSKISKQLHPLWNDPRPSAVKLAHSILAQKLTQQNLARVTANTRTNYNQLNNVTSKMSMPQQPKCYDNLTFITISGVPPYQNQYDAFKFPGKVVDFRVEGFEGKGVQLNSSVSQKDEISKPTSKGQFKLSKDLCMLKTLNRLHELVVSLKSRIVLVIHSFGGVVGAYYCHLHPDRVQGIISFGGPPVRFYPIMKEFAKSFKVLEIMMINQLEEKGISNSNSQAQNTPSISNKSQFGMTPIHSYVHTNAQTVSQLYQSAISAFPSKLQFRSANELISFVLHNTPQQLAFLFQRVREMRNVGLRLLLWGGKDKVIGRERCEEAIVASIVGNIDGNEANNNEKLANKANPNYPCHPLQSKFVYLLEDHGHSVHLHNLQLLQVIIDQYLAVLFEGKASL